MLEVAQLPDFARARNIVSQVAARHSFAVADVMAADGGRPAPMILARHELAFELRRQMNWSFEHIGRFMKRDRSSVRRAIKQHSRRNGQTEATPT